jgi:DNA-directed RNA polymerase specialized sigma24 family protein
LGSPHANDELLQHGYTLDQVHGMAESAARAFQSAPGASLAELYDVAFDAMMDRLMKPDDRDHMPRSYLGQAAKWAVLDYLKRQRTHIMEPLTFEDGEAAFDRAPTVDDGTAQVDARMDADSMLSELDPEDERLVRDWMRLDHNWAAVGRERGWSKQTARNRGQRALAACREAAGVG